MKLLLCISILGFTGISVGANAAEISGIISVQPNSSNIFIQVQGTSSSYKVTASNPDLLLELTQLKNGDYIFGNGTLPAPSSAAPTVIFDSIESIGLAELLGTWTTPDNDVFDFHDFTHLNLYKSNSTSSGTSLTPTQSFQYILTPDSGNSYQIFLSEAGSVHAGTLTVKDQQATLSVYDSNTGQVAQSFNLVPITIP